MFESLKSPLQLTEKQKGKLIASCLLSLIGCGGGVLLNMALESVTHAKAIDHSPDMVRIARDGNQKALSEGRVETVQDDAESLPWGDDLFTCATAAEMDMASGEMWAQFAASMVNSERSGAAQQAARIVSELPEFSAFKKILDLGGIIRHLNKNTQTNRINL